MSQETSTDRQPGHDAPDGVWTGAPGPFADTLADPFDYYERARREAPVHFDPDLNAWLVTRMDDLRQVTRDIATFSSANALRPIGRLHPAAFPVLAQAYGIGSNATNADGDEHRRLRAPMVPWFGEEGVARVAPYVRRRAIELLDELAATPRADLIAAYALPLPIDVIAELFGIPEADRAALRDRVDRANWVINPHSIHSAEQAVDGAHGMVEAQNMIADAIVERRLHPRDDLLGDLAAAYLPGQGPTTRDELAQAVPAAYGLLVAGHRTSTALIGNAVQRLLTERDRWEALVADPGLIPSAIEEVLRYDTPVQGFFRVTTRPTTLGGHDLPAGADVLVLYGSANRDEALCPHAGDFDLTREPTRHVAFGYGAHTCVGARLARHTVETTLELLTSRLPGLRLDPDREVERYPRLIEHGPATLPVLTGAATA